MTLLPLQQVYSDSLLTNPLLFADDAPSFNSFQVTPPTPIRSISPREGSIYCSEEDLTAHQLSPETSDQRRMSAPLSQQQRNLGLMNIPNFGARRQSDPSVNNVPTISISPTEGQYSSSHPNMSSPINSKLLG